MIIMSRLSDKVSKCPVLMQFGAAAVILMVVGGSGYYTHYMMVVKPRIMAVGMAMENTRQFLMPNQTILIARFHIVPPQVKTFLEYRRIGHYSLMQNGLI